MPLGRRTRGLLRPALALAVMLSFVASFLLGGHRYFYCAQMNEVSLEACCQRSAEAAGDEGPSVLDGDGCCASEHFLASAPGVTPASDATLRAPMIAVLPAIAPSAAPTLPAVRAQERRARAGPAATPREHRQRLMVFLT